ncbi:MAG TPA: hypothetical protein VFZ46_00450 [Nitrososphaeraceae archaeon]
MRLNTYKKLMPLICASWILVTAFFVPPSQKEFDSVSVIVVSWL